MDTVKLLGTTVSCNQERACTEFCAQRNKCAAEGDSPIFADTKIGTVPQEPGCRALRLVADLPQVQRYGRSYTGRYRPPDRRRHALSAKMLAFAGKKRYYWCPVGAITAISSGFGCKTPGAGNLSSSSKAKNLAAIREGRRRGIDQAPPGNSAQHWAALAVGHTAVAFPQIEGVG